MKNEIFIEVLVLKRLKDLFFRIGEEQIIHFPEVFARICLIFCISKDEAWAGLRSMEQRGLIEIVPFHGMKFSNPGKVKT